MRRPVPTYMFEGAGAMTNLVDAIEAKMLRDFSRKLDSQGITNAGVKVPVSAMSGMGSLGALKFGSNLKRIAGAITGKTRLKAVKAANVAAVAAKQAETAKRLAAQSSGTSKQKYVVAAKTADAIKKAAIKEAAAPTVTKKEILDAARPQIRQAAIAAASGAKRGIAVARKAGQIAEKPKSWRGTKASDAGVISRQIRLPFTAPLNNVPASSYEEETDVSGFGDAGVDVTSGGDAFGLDVSQGADAFGMDVSNGADAFGMVDVSQGGDAFGYLGADEAAAAASESAPTTTDEVPPAPISLAPGSKGAFRGSGVSGKTLAIGAGVLVGGLVLAKVLKKRS